MTEELLGLGEEELVERFKEFVLGNEAYLNEITNMIIQQKKSLEVDFNDVLIYDKEMADLLVERPRLVIRAASGAVRDIMIEKEPDVARRLRTFYARFRRLPETIHLRRLRSPYIGKLVQVEGIVTRQTPPRHFLHKATYKCQQCGYEVELVQELERHVEPPQKCPRCGAARSLVLTTERSEYVDWQKIIVQERPEELPPGQLPRSVEAVLVDDLVDAVKPGDIVSMTGILELAISELRKNRPPVVSSYIDVNHIESVQKELIEDITPDDERRITELANSPNIQDRIVRSIAPSIHGHEEIKEAIACALFGGNELVYPDGIRVRGDVHILLVGDPGTGKSQLLRFVAKVAPRAVYTTGKGSSAAGLTAAVVRDKLTGDFYLEAGALVLADRGIAIIDEIDKMDAKDRVAIHEAMEQQTVSLAKAGIVATLNARCSVLAAANPAFGRYLPNRTIAENIDLPVSLLSRFDLIFVLRDEPNPDRDKALADHVLSLHTDELPGAFRDAIKPDLLRKYIMYARRHVRPQFTREARERVLQFYLEMRKASNTAQGTSVMITARQLEALVRLSMAEAKMRLSPVVSPGDVERAIRLYLAFLRSVGIDVESGIDVVMTGIPTSKRERYVRIVEIVRDLEERVRGPVRIVDVIAEAEKHGITREETQQIIDMMVRQGELYMPKPGYVRRVI